MRSDWRHAPPDYRCPMCRLLIGDFNDLNAASDIARADWADRLRSALAPGT